MSLTSYEWAMIEDLFGEDNLREMIAHYGRMQRDRKPGRLGIFAHLNGCGEVVANEKHVPPETVDRRTA